MCIKPGATDCRRLNQINKVHPPNNGEHNNRKYLNNVLGSKQLTEKNNYTNELCYRRKNDRLTAVIAKRQKFILETGNAAITSLKRACIQTNRL